ncbi:MAG: peptide deformylase [Dysgonamonadaceae bacterium]|jgi:peptide deformylase|nr:peptide deformylase [Dysgonamonadaceae bacterium]
MKGAKIGWILAALSGLCISCKTVQPFAEAEKALIVSATAEKPFRVLQITEKADALLLRKPCSDIQPFAADPAFHLLVARLKKTLEIEQGVGIAAPQVGISKNLFLFMRLDEPDHRVQVAVNPKIVNHPDTTVCFERDGCLSIPGFQGNSRRYPWVEVEYWNEKGEKIRERLEGYSRRDSFTAIIFQHEYDHTRGILFTDKLCE